MTKFAGMHREGNVEHSRFLDGSTVTVRRDWSLADAEEGLIRDWLNPAVEGSEEISEGHLSAWHQPRHIRDSLGKLRGVLLSPEDYEEGRDAVHTINQDAYGQADDGYKPFQHQPTATTDRIIGTETLEKVIRKLVDQDEKPTDDQIHYAALVAALEFSFDPDSRGLVPVMTPTRASDSMHTEYHWSFLKPTPVAGIYIRLDDQIFGGIGYSLVAGSGYKLVGGFFEEDYVAELAVKLGEATPGQNWFTLTQGSLTKELRETYVGIIREHGTFRKDD